jgi:hypothetical protein
MKKAQASGVIVIVAFVVIFLIVYIIFFSGIAGDGSLKPIGTEALSLSFYKLPTIISQNQEFNIDVIARNKGEYEIPKGVVRVVLNNAQNFGITNVIKRNDEKIRNEENGGEAEFIYPKAKYVGTVVSEEIPQVVSVGFCYPYKTENIKVENICFAPSLTNELCAYIGEKDNITNSGAPVHLTSFKQVNSIYNTGEEYVEIMTKLKFEKVGSGSVYSPKANCDNINPENVDMISIDSITLGTKKITGDDLDNVCRLDNGIVDLSSGQITCIFRQTGIKTDITNVISMTLSYVYSHQLKGSVKVIPGFTS